MMDFLRRLAPARDGDTARAVGALPSRFERDTPLRVTAPVARTEMASPMSSKRSSTPEAQAAVPMALHAREEYEVPVDTSASRLDVSARSRENAADRISDATSKAHSQPMNEGSLPFESFFGDEASHAAQADTVAYASAAAGTPRHGSRLDGSRGLAKPASEIPSATHPLSGSALASRVKSRSDTDSVVHVTIGRIDVVTNAAPAAATRRTHAPRKPTVTLADYLRNGRGG